MYVYFIFPANLSWTLGFFLQIYTKLHKFTQSITTNLHLQDIYSFIFIYFLQKSKLLNFHKR